MPLSRRVPRVHAVTRPVTVGTDLVPWRGRQVSPWLPRSLPREEVAAHRPHLRRATRVPLSEDTVSTESPLYRAFVSFLPLI